MASAAHPPLEIRRAEAGDLPAARTLLHRVLAEDLGYGLRPDWHWDIWDTDALAAAYLDHPRQALFVAVAPDGAVAGCAAVRADGPRTPPHPAWLSARYAGDDAGQIARVWIGREHRRRGLARRLVAATTEWAAEAGYRLLCLHTDAAVPGAEAFWRSLPVRQVWDDGAGTLHFEWPLDALVPAGAGPR